MRPWHEIVDIVETRRRDDATLKQVMQDIRDRVNGDYVIPLLDVEGQPIAAPLAPQVIVSAIENVAMRAASTKPMIAVPQKYDSATASRAAAKGRQGFYGIWNESKFLKIGVRRAFRHLAGYGSLVIHVMPDTRDGLPRIEVRDPLYVYPEPRSPEDTRPVDDVAMIYAKPAGTVIRMFPTLPDGTDTMRVLGTAVRNNEAVDLLHWIDGDEIVYGVLGLRKERRLIQYGSVQPTELARVPNRAGMVPVAVGTAVTLDRMASSVSRIIGVADLLDRFTALEAIAAERAVFPDRYVLGRDGRPPMILGGEWKDGRTGEMNVIVDAAGVGELVSTIGPNTAQVKSSLERAARLTAADPGLFSGELNGSIRSGQTVNALGSFAVDPRVAEMQDIMGAHLETVNQAIAKVAKGYFQSKTFYLHSGKPSDHLLCEVKPDDLPERTAVQYAFPGSDINQITVALGQMVASQMVSQETARAQHPLIDNPEQEAQRIVEEALHSATLDMVRARAAQGAIEPLDMANLLKAMRDGDLVQALIDVDRQARERQATPAPATAPESMPGLAADGPSAMSMVEPPPMPGAGVVDRLQGTRELARALVSAPQAFGAQV